MCRYLSLDSITIPKDMDSDWGFCRVNIQEYACIGLFDVEPISTTPFPAFITNDGVGNLRNINTTKRVNSIDFSPLNFGADLAIDLRASIVSSGDELNNFI